MPIPKADNQRIQWTINVEAEFPPIASDFGFSGEETKAVLDDSRTMRFVIQNGQKAQAHSKASNSFKYDLLGNSQDGLSEPELPVYTPVEPPATIAPRGILKRFSKWEERLKAHPNYNDAIGDLLQINAAQSADVSPDAAKGKGQATAMADSVVRIDWTKGEFDGVLIEGQRGDETVMTQLGRDFRSPFTDERAPLQAGKPEERRYRLRYLLDDEPVGEWSDVIVIITKP
jgi:hypothetical protein